MTTHITVPHPPAPDRRTGVAAVAEEAANLAGWAWIPIRSLSPRHRPSILAHLLALTPYDRYQRFGYPANDAQIVRYADALDFDRDEVFGIFNRRLEIIALAHLAYAPAPTSDGPPMAEFGVSVLPSKRGRSFGRRLFDHAALHARNRGIETLFVHALSENAPMLRIARSAGAIVERWGSESEARLKLPPDTFGTHLDEAIEEHAAEMDYRWKVQLTRVNGLLDVIAKVKACLGGRARAAAH